MSRERVKAEPVRVSAVQVASSSRVNAPGDRFEVEAERLAQKVTGGPAGIPVDVWPADTQVQRAAEGAAPIPALTDSLQLGGDEPLPAAVEARMAGSLGHRFDQVRVHRGGYADRVSRQLNAHAFAYDQHLFFSDGAYDPHSANGQRLIGHELVHTLQQRDRNKGIQRTEAPLTHIVAVHIYLDTGRVVVKTENASYGYELLGKNATNIEAGETFYFRHTKGQNKDTELTPGKFFNVFGPNWGDYPSSSTPYPVTAYSSIQTGGDQGRAPAEDQDASGGAGNAGTGKGAEGDIGAGAGIGAEPEKGDDTLQDFIDRMGGSGEDATSMSDEDERKIKTILDQLEAEEVDQFFKTLDEIAGACEAAGECPSKSYAELLEFFNNLSGPDREALSINRMLKTDPTAASDTLPEKILLNIEADALKAAEGAQDIQTLNQNLALIQAKVTDPTLKEKLGDIDLEQISELNTLFMIQGLLAGASERLPAIQPVTQELSVNIFKIRQALLDEIAFLAAETAIVAAGSALAAPVSAGGSLAAGAAATGLILLRLNRLKRLFETFSKMNAAINSIKSVIDSVEEVKDNLAVVDFKEFEQRIDEVNALYAQLKGPSPPDNIDKLIETAENKLLLYAQENILKHLDDVLDQMYLPEDMTDQELKKLLFDIPAGIEAMEQMLAFKEEIEAGNADNSVTLSLKGFQAGYLLAPFVGFLTDKINTALAGMMEEKDWSDLLLGAFMPKKARRLKKKKKGATKKRFEEIKTNKQKKQARAAEEARQPKKKKKQDRPEDQQSASASGRRDPAWQDLESHLRQLEKDAINQNGMTKADIEKTIKSLLQSPSLASFNPQLDIELYRNKPGLYRVVVRDRSRDNAGSAARRKKQKRKKGFARAKNTDAVGNIVQPETTRHKGINKKVREVFRDWPAEKAEGKPKIAEELTKLKKTYCYPIQICHPGTTSPETGDVFIQDKVASGEIIAFKVMSRLQRGKPVELITIEKPGHHWGSERNPIMLDWKKWAFDQYDPIYIGPYVADDIAIRQTDLEGLQSASEKDRKSFADDLLANHPGISAAAIEGITKWKRNGALVETYIPREKKKLPPKSHTKLGVDKDDWGVRTGFKQRFIPKERRHESGATFTDKIKIFGYRPTDEKSDGDHIYEIQVGGKDRVENMWTLDSKINQDAGNALKTAVISRPDGTTTSMPTVKELAKQNIKAGRKMFIQIKSVVSR